MKVLLLRHNRLKIDYIRTSYVRTLDQLNTHLQEEINTEESVVYLIPQRFSWGRLQITPEAFESIRIQKCIFPGILHVLREFGSKTFDNLPQHCSFQGGRSGNQANIYELCYINRYVERNGRGRGDPWSLRQTGVYQRIHLDTGYSSCVVLQISKSVRKLLNHTIKDHASRRFGAGAQMMQLHLLILLSTADNWGEYIDHLYSMVKDVNEKACFSDIENASIHDYIITFADVQNLQKLRNKVLRTSLVLDSCLELADRLAAFCRQLEIQDSLLNGSSVSISVELYAADIKTHQRNITMILQSVDGTADIITKILEFRNRETIRIVDNATARNLSTLKDITADIAKQSKRTNAIATKTQKDSMSLKALTTVATGFLPPTLLATIWSSSLVEPQHSASGRESHFIFTKQFWIYVLISLGATALTWLCINIIERWSLRSRGDDELE